MHCRSSDKSMPSWLGWQRSASVLRNAVMTLLAVAGGSDDAATQATVCDVRSSIGATVVRSGGGLVVAAAAAAGGGLAVDAGVGGPK